MDYLYYLQNLREGCLKALNPVFMFISEIGTGISILSIFVLYWIFNKKAGKKIILAFSVSTCIANFVKNLFCVNRPWISDSRLRVHPTAARSATGYSFPSGHSTTAASTLGGLAIYKKKIIISSLLVLSIFAIMFSRNWLGCHTLADVFTGFAIGVFSIILSFLFLDKIESSSKASVLFFIFSFLFCITAIFYVLFKSYPEAVVVDGKPLVDIWRMKEEAVKNIGNFFGFTAGWFLEKQFVNFENPETKNKRILTFFLGIFSAGLVYGILLLTKFFLPSTAGAFICHTGIFFWAVCGFPWVMKIFYQKKGFESFAFSS